VAGREPGLLRRYPLNGTTVSVVFGMMQVAGLYSWETNWFDCGLRRLIRRARACLSDLERGAENRRGLTPDGRRATFAP
jgi:hypothetical protein